MLVVYRDETIATVRDRLRRLEGAKQADIDNDYWQFCWFDQVRCSIGFSDTNETSLFPEGEG